MAGPTEEAEVTRADRFIKTAVEILGETGRTDFTVQEVVARSKTSLRAFYQHFASKDELLLALFERTMAQAAQTLACRDRRPGQHRRAETDHRPCRRTAGVHDPGQPEPGTESLQPEPGRDPAPRIRPGPFTAASFDARHHRTGHHRGRLQTRTGRRRRRGDRHADHGRCAPVALAGNRIERDADRLRPTVRLLQPRPRASARPKTKRPTPPWPNCSRRSACARPAFTMADPKTGSR